jgi:hypothetical protein
MQKVEKASRKSRKRKTATYKEDEISHSSDLDSSTDEEAEVRVLCCVHPKGAGLRLCAVYSCASCFS